MKVNFYLIYFYLSLRRLRVVRPHSVPKLSFMKQLLPWSYLELCLFFSLMGLGLKAQPQLYEVTFETGRTHPAVKGYASLDTVLCDSLPWIMPGVNLPPSMSANEFYIGARAARMRLTDNTSGQPAYLEMLADLPNGIQTVDFYAAMFGNETGGVLLVQASIDQGQSWFAISDTLFITGRFDSAMAIHLTPAIAQPARIKIKRLDPQPTRINIDQISLSPFGYGSHLFLIDKSPTGTGVPLSLDVLSCTFDAPIQPQSGYLSVHDNRGGQQSFSIPSPQVRIVDSSVFVEGFLLQSNTSYYVLLDSGAFTDNQGLKSNLAISDSSYWTFQTIDTVSVQPPAPLQELNENFRACNPAQELIGVFKAFKVRGEQAWQCASEGRDDPFSVSVSGGFGPGISVANEQWLITRLPLDLSEKQRPFLSFWEKAQFNGDANRQVLLSFDYPGSGSPYHPLVNWITLNIPGINERPPNNWHLVEGIDLTEFKHQSFYLAFTYSCGTEGSYRLFYDDIRIQDPTSLVSKEKLEQGQQVSVSTFNRQLQIHFKERQQQIVAYRIHNLLGQKLKEGLLDPRQSSARFETIPLKDWASGIYFLQLHLLQKGKPQLFQIKFWLP